MCVAPYTNDRVRRNKGRHSSIAATALHLMRERQGAPLGRTVLFVHGRSAAAVPSFDLEYRDYSWMVYLADAGFDVFAVDLQGYGNSSKPTVMDEPCNTSADNQAKYLVPNPLRAPCPPRYPHSFGSFATDWNEIDTVVEFIRSLRGHRALKVNLVGWSRGGMRVIGYAALRNSTRSCCKLPREWLRSGTYEGRPGSSSK
jgi:pimeloyl-ACP methyl ester carboxylesterase